MNSKDKKQLKEQLTKYLVNNKMMTAADKGMEEASDELRKMSGIDGTYRIDGIRVRVDADAEWGDFDIDILDDTDDVIDL